MFQYLGFSEDFTRLHVEELLQEAEHARLASLAARHGRPARDRVAEWLVATAERIDGRPRALIARAAEA